MTSAELEQQVGMARRHLARAHQLIAELPDVDPVSALEAALQHLTVVVEALVRAQRPPRPGPR